MAGGVDLAARVAAHSGWLSAFLRGLTRSEVDAEDAFQEVWARVARLTAPPKDDAWRGYLARVARSVVIDRHRRDARCLAILDAPAEEGGVSAETLEDPSPDPAARFSSAATREEVLAAVRRLPAGPRQVFLMRVEGELAFREIAEELGVPLGTALTWMRAATLKLRKELENRD